MKPRMNEDGFVDEADYELLLEYAYGGPEGPGPYVPPFEEWLDSDEAEDFNEDGFVDEADYELLLGVCVWRSRRSWSLCAAF